ncbi:hypothetical protein CWI36_1102p0010 [Hamiltosporidium magnivora]|uniref:Uncharacterized protein n=1 Tax=Hamiltosporidium magnivora TaxID=148818 RepID=A0A4Q9L5R9_9MICR|nr:hypothetical protein CWI36_1102p0010 [Hamiltosporidium magnivora]
MDGTLFHILYIIISLEFVVTRKYISSLQKNENSNIVFFRLNTKEMLFSTAIDKNYQLKITFCDDLKFFDEKIPVFTYKKEKFIGFEVLNIVLSSSVTYGIYKNIILESDFELSYFLRLKKDIAEFPFVFNNYQSSHLEIFDIERNSILLENINESYDSTLIDKCAPYKTLMINNLKVLCILEKLFKNIFFNHFSDAFEHNPYKIIRIKQ